MSTQTDTTPRTTWEEPNAVQIHVALDARAYAKWLSETTGKVYRLLSESEWEYACRAGTRTPYSFGQKILPQQAQFSHYKRGDAAMTVPVGSFPSNAFGLHDMHGNVNEWCEDVMPDQYWLAHYGGDPADVMFKNYKNAPTDGSPRLSNDPSASRVLRGGSWVSTSEWLRSAARNSIRPAGCRQNSIGFRVARIADATS